MRKLLLLLVALVLLVSCGGGESGSSGSSGSSDEDCRTNGQCGGCCSNHDGVVCIDGKTMCGDGSPLSETCRNKGCSACVGCSNNNTGSPPKDGSCPMYTAASCTGDLCPGKENLPVFDNGPLYTQTNEGRTFELFTGGLFTDIDGWKTDPDCAQDGSKWGFSFSIYRVDQNNIRYIEPDYFPQIQVQINGAAPVACLHDKNPNNTSQYSGQFWIPISFSDPTIDPFEEYFNQIDQILIDGVPINMSTRNY